MKNRELNIFFNAILYYTRIRVPRSVTCSEESLNNAFRYFPLVGGVVGGVGALTFLAVSYLLGVESGFVAASVAMLLVTGALHEDGLADFADGFGGGRDKESILRIMKDSYIGAFGVIALISLFLFKYSLANSISGSALWIVILCSQVVSRFNSVLMVRSAHYARLEGAKASHTTLGVSVKNLIFAMVTSLAALIPFGWLFGSIYILSSLLLFLLFRSYIVGKIDGFTGDTLGALQQLSELLFYVVFVALY